MKELILFTILFTVLGFCLGSTMFAYLIPKLLKKVDIRKQPQDHNPGVANAFTYGGFWPGMLSLLCELAKGFLPVYVCQNYNFISPTSLLFAPIMAAPVIGHAFPFFQMEKGGKAIAVSFGVTIGLLPEARPLFYLIVFFLFFSLILVIQPHSFRAVVTFGLFSLFVLLRVKMPSIQLGCLMISGVVILKHCVKYQGERLKVNFVRRTQ